MISHQKATRVHSCGACFLVLLLAATCQAYYLQETTTSSAPSSVTTSQPSPATTLAPTSTQQAATTQQPTTTTSASPPAPPSTTTESQASPDAAPATTIKSPLEDKLFSNWSAIEKPVEVPEATTTLIVIRTSPPPTSTSAPTTARPEVEVAELHVEARNGGAKKFDKLLASETPSMSKPHGHEAETVNLPVTSRDLGKELQDMANSSASSPMVVGPVTLLVTLTVALAALLGYQSWSRRRRSSADL